MRKLEIIFSDNPNLKNMAKFSSGVGTLLRAGQVHYSTVHITELNTCIIVCQGKHFELYPNDSTVHKFLLHSTLK